MEGEERTIIHSLKKKKFSFGNAIYHLYLTVIVVWTIVMKAFFPVGGWHFELQQFVLNPYYDKVIQGKYITNFELKIDYSLS